MSERNVQDCKIFVGGLEMDTNNDSMRTYFEQFGETSDVIVMRDGATKKSRGFGFVIFMDPSSVTECLKVSSHMLDGKAVEVKKAVPKEESFPNVPKNRTKKVFLGGISPETTKEDIMAVVEQHGELMDVQVMTEKGTNKPRGFAFAIFQDFEGAERLIEKKYQKIRDREVEVKPAISQEEMRQAGGGGGGGKRGAPNGDAGGYGGGAGGRGGPDPYRGYGKAAYPMDYRGYDYRGYEYMRPDYMGGGGGYPAMYERSMPSGYQNYGYGRNYGQQGYEMGGYGMYPSQGMGSYQQAPSTYGPSRGYGGGGDKDKDRGGRGGYHPYRRN